MPLTGFVCPTTNEIIPLDTAPAYFDEAGVMPAEALQAILDHDESRANDDPRFLSPSQLNPDTNCRREKFLKAYLPYQTAPWQEWAAMEGTLWHETFTRAVDGGWGSNVRVPMTGRIEVWPGVWLAGSIDRVRPGTIIDHKTKRAPFLRRDGTFMDRALEEAKEWEIQLNTYRYLWEAETGDTVTNLWAWRMYRGMSKSNHVFRKIPVRLVPKEQIWERVGEYITSLLVWLRQGYEVRGDEVAVKALAATIPMDGRDKAMFNGSKCERYCSMRSECYRLAGLVQF